VALILNSTVPDCETASVGDTRKLNGCHASQARLALEITYEIMKITAPNHVLSAERFRVFHYEGEIKSLALSGCIDAYVVSTEEGFSPLGSNLKFLADDLGVSAQEIRRLADWNRFENTNVSLVAIHSRNSKSLLKGVILAACETAKCYARFGESRYNRKPSRNFYYNVSYEAFSLAATAWGARRVALSHLSACNRFHSDIATCAVEAFAHLAAQNLNSVESLTFLKDSEINLEHLDGARMMMNSDSVALGVHTPAFLVTEELDGGHTVIHISIPRGKAKLTRVI